MSRWLRLVLYFQMLRQLLAEQNVRPYRLNLVFVVYTLLQGFLWHSWLG